MYAALAAAAVTATAAAAVVENLSCVRTSRRIPPRQGIKATAVKGCPWHTLLRPRRERSLITWLAAGTAIVTLL